MKRPQSNLTSYQNLLQQHGVNKKDTCNQARSPKLPEGKVKDKTQVALSKSSEKPKISKLSLSFYKKPHDSIPLHQKSINLNTHHKSTQSTRTTQHHSSLSFTPNSNFPTQKHLLQEIKQVLFRVIKLYPPSLLKHKISYIQYLECLKQFRMIDESYDPMINKDDPVADLWNSFVSKNTVSNFVNVLITVFSHSCPNINQKENLTVNFLGSKQPNTNGINNRYGQLITNRQKYSLIQGNNHINSYCWQELDHSQENLLETSQNIKRDNDGQDELYSFREQIKTQRSMDKSIQQIGTKKENTKRQQNIKSRIRLIRRLKTCQKNNHQNKSFQKTKDPCITSQKEVTSNLSTNSYEFIENILRNKNRPIKTGDKCPEVNITQYLTKNLLRTKDPTGNHRSQQLYQLSRQKSQQKRSNKSTIQYEYQKQRKELTFHPHINSCNQLFQKKKYANPCLTVNVKVRGASSMVKRLTKGRIDNEIKKIITQKGLPYNDNIIRKLRQQKDQELRRKIHVSQKHNETEQKIQMFQQQADEETQQSQVRYDQQSAYEKQFQKQPIQSIFSQQSPEDNQTLIKLTSPIIIKVQCDQKTLQLIVNLQHQTFQESALRFLNQHNLSLEFKQPLVQHIKIALHHCLPSIAETEDQQESLFNQ